MPAAVVPKAGLALGPGYLLWAPLGTAIPTNTVVGSVFTDAWSAPWALIGITDAGSTFSYQLNTGEVDAEEYLDPLLYVSTGRSQGIAFAMANISATNFKLAVNGGVVTVTGATTTTLSKLAPPALGAEVRIMLGWESTDATERFIGYQAFQTGQVQTARRKGTAKATIPVDYRLEQPASGDPWNYYTAGVVRA
jgi:hypothetical protein